jgi:hypothetical protein
MAAGAAAVAGDWLLFLHADTRLEGDWITAITDFIGAPEMVDGGSADDTVALSQTHGARTLSVPPGRGGQMAAGAAAAGGAARIGPHLGRTLSPRRLFAAFGAQPVLPGAILSRHPATRPTPPLWVSPC